MYSSFPLHPSPHLLTESVVNIYCYVQKFCISVFLIFILNLAVICLNCIWFHLILYLFNLAFPLHLCLFVVVVGLNLTCFQKSKLHWRKYAPELLISHLFLPVFSFLSLKVSCFFLFLIHACCFFLQK